MEQIFDGCFDKTLDIEEKDSTQDLILLKESRGTLLIRIQPGCETLKLNVESVNDSDGRILILQKADNEVKLDIHVNVCGDAKLRMGILDIEPKGLQLDLGADLNESGADFEIYTAMLAEKEGPKVSSINVNQHEPHTFGNIHNFAVLYDKARYEMAAAGRIDKGARDSESHQETRVLTLGKDHQAKVLPILYIDENDVKASHAMTVGQPDEDQLYYLESRGLSAASAMSLLAIGYFMPVIELAPDETLRQQLQAELERKAGLYGY